MLRLPSGNTPPIPTDVPHLAYEPLEEGKNYWVKDDTLPNPMEVRERCLASTNWFYGAPYKASPWPGMRTFSALNAQELSELEGWVRSVTGVSQLQMVRPAKGKGAHASMAQLVGAADSDARPHTDWSEVSRYAAVIYLTPNPEPAAGTSFYRQRYANGAIGGNHCSSPHRNLVEALDLKNQPAPEWYEEKRIDNVFNRVVLYKSTLVHSATSYFGDTLQNKRLTAGFFWMSEGDSW